MGITECKIKWLDDEKEEYVWICSSDEETVECNDDDIFFYGMTREECIEAMENKTACENEWQIMEVY